MVWKLSEGFKCSLTGVCELLGTLKFSTILCNPRTLLLFILQNIVPHGHTSIHLGWVWGSFSSSGSLDPGQPVVQGNRPELCSFREYCHLHALAGLLVTWVDKLRVREKAGGTELPVVTVSLPELTTRTFFYALWKKSTSLAVWGKYLDCI